jgi:RimJ/RimL family protein N-acetyltransferase
MVQLNAYHQPIGPSLPHWQARPQPARCVLHGKYCRLEAVNPEQHGDSLYEAYSNASDGRDWTYLSVGPFNNRAQFDQHLQTISQASNAVHYAVVEQTTGRALGTLSLMRIDPQNGCIEVGFVAWSPALKQTRMATEAHYLLMAYAIGGLGYRRYEWKCDTHNAPSQAAARRLGFRYEGIFRQAIVYKGRSRDTAWFSITDQDWPALKANFQAWLAPENFDDQGRQKHRLGQQTTVAPAGPGARRLKQMLALQTELNQLIDPNWRVAKQDYYRAIWVECAELANYLDWKWWQHNERNLPQLQLELIDILHFGLCAARARSRHRTGSAPARFSHRQRLYGHHDGSGTLYLARSGDTPVRFQRLCPTGCSLWSDTGHALPLLRGQECPEPLAPTARLSARPLSQAVGRAAGQRASGTAAIASAHRA